MPALFPSPGAGRFSLPLGQADGEDDGEDEEDEEGQPQPQPHAQPQPQFADVGLAAVAGGEEPGHVGAAVGEDTAWEGSWTPGSGPGWSLGVRILQESRWVPRILPRGGEKMGEPAPCPWVGVKGWGLGVKDWGSGSQGMGFRANWGFGGQGMGFGVKSWGLEVKGWVWGVRSWDLEVKGWVWRARIGFGGQKLGSED